MYDLTHNRIYLDHLRDLSRVVLSFRDDRRGEQPRAVDAFLGQVMPAWDQRGVACGSLHHASLDAAGIYSYPIAAFARIVSENPELHVDYGADAVAFANAVLQTVAAFSNELRSGSDDSKYLAHPRAVSDPADGDPVSSGLRRGPYAGNGPDGWIVKESTLSRADRCSGSMG